MTRPPHAASSVVGYASDTASAVAKVEPNSNRSRETGRPYITWARHFLPQKRGLFFSRTVRRQLEMNIVSRVQLTFQMYTLCFSSLLWADSYIHEAMVHALIFCNIVRRFLYSFCPGVLSSIHCLRGSLALRNRVRRKDGDVIMSAWHLKSPASRLVTEPFIEAQIKEKIKAPRHWPLCGEFSGDWWISRKNGQWRGKCFHFMTSSCHLVSSIFLWFLITTCISSFRSGNRVGTRFSSQVKSNKLRLDMLWKIEFTPMRMLIYNFCCVILRIYCKIHKAGPEAFTSHVDREWNVKSVIRSYIYGLNKASGPWI